MHDLKTIKKTLALLDRYDGQFAKVSRETGIKAKTIRVWYNKRRDGKPLVCERRSKRSKWSDEQKKAVVDYYFEHGRSVSKAANRFGYPSASMLKRWVREDPRFGKPRKCRQNPNPPSEEEARGIVLSIASGESTLSEAAREAGVSRATVYAWKKRLAGGAPVRGKKGAASKKELEEEIKALRSEKARLEMENAMLRKAAELLKKEKGADLSLLTSKEKAGLAGALKGRFPISAMLEAMGMARSTYFYEAKAMKRDKYADIRPKIKALFAENYSCYGYRRMKEAMAKAGSPLSEKVVRRLMREEKLSVYLPRKRKYSSYAGEITPGVENVIKRDFFAEEPYRKCLTDITEFSLKGGKVYLSPLIDCSTGTPITWTIGTSPSGELAGRMLDQGHRIAGDSKMLIHSDRGFHYRIPGWIDRMREYGYERSMSKKGCSPDNSACEGFFGTMKNEFYYPRDWSKTGVSEFMDELESYLQWFVSKRIKGRLGYCAPDSKISRKERLVQ